MRRYSTINVSIGALLVSSLAAVGSTPAQRPGGDITVESRRTVMESGPGRPPFDLTRHTIPLDEIIGGGPPIDGIPALGMTEPPRFIPGDTADWLDADHLIIGVRIGDQARAYPIQILNWHEAVNDVFNVDDEEVPIAVVWCPLCGSATVMSRRVEANGAEMVLTFGISGKLYNSNVLLYDAHTYSLWSQFTGTAVTGALAGTPYEMLPSDTLAVSLERQDVRHTAGRDWRNDQPGSRVLAREGQVTPGAGRRDYDRDPYARMPRRVGGRIVGSYDYHDEGTPLMFEPANRPPPDVGLDDKARVLGVYFGPGRYKAYPLTELEKAGGEVAETLGGRTLVIHYENEHSAYVTTPSGTQVPAHHTYWFAWYAFHPDTELFRAR